ncbi:immunoglobulin domain-containing protein [Pseudoclavibacter sp. 13-3]|uniref:immunoglobulin domain-containing protein n=1 Tax=Pseudoclavibacter sp. 13-3 TaxID=2901228 RepID=UPI001E35C583|nr:immunoglobulin domain-containing protein [Pseudoclavibacter sp. 13-3]MCD7100993.1 immunoglobulin domain-containing protein [Pseudoclavibacter sp. 13-3]
MYRTGRPRPVRGALAVGLSAVLAIGGAIAGTTFASAADDSKTVSDATFAWGMNHESGNGGYMPGSCNYLVAGKIPNPGTGNTQLTKAGYDGATDAGNASVLKPDLQGTLSPATWENSCLSVNGKRVAAGAHADVNDYSLNEVHLTKGTGEIDSVKNTADIAWRGSWTVVYYSGLTLWYAADPHLSVNTDGSATITATASGFGSSMEDMTQWVSIPDRQITLADFSAGSVKVTETGVTTKDGKPITPQYEGVQVTDDTGQVLNPSGNPQGSFPQSFVDFQKLTGQSSYWYSSNGGADPNKPATAVTVGYTAQAKGIAPTITAQPADATVVEGRDATFTVAAAGTPQPTVQWQSKVGTSDWGDVAGATATTLTVSSAALTASGTQYRAVLTNTIGTATSTAATLTVQQAATPVTAVTVDSTDTTGLGITVAGTNYTNLPDSSVGAFLNNGVYAAVIDSATDLATIDEASGFIGEAKWIAQKDIVDGAFTTQLKAPADKLDRTRTYQVLIWRAHGMPTGNAVIDRRDISVTDEQWDQVFPESVQITGQPESTTARAGQQATFTATATGLPLPAATWQSKTGDADWTDVPATSVTTTSQRPTVTTHLTIDAATIAQNDTQYRAVFTNPASAAGVTTDPARLVVNDVPTAVAKPTVTKSKTSVVEVSWQKPAENNSAVTGYTVTLTPADGSAPQTAKAAADATSSVFDGLVAPGVAYTATVTAANDLGASAASAVSDPVIATPRLAAGVTGSVSTAPAQNLLQVQVDGSGFVPTDLPQYWSDGSKVWKDSAGVYAALVPADVDLNTITATDGHLGVQYVTKFGPGALADGTFTTTLQVAAKDDEGQPRLSRDQSYKIIVWNAHGLPQSPNQPALLAEAPVSITTAQFDALYPEKPVVQSQPTDQTAVEGDDVTFSAEVSGAPAPKLQWQRSTDGQNWADVEGATESALTLKAVTLAQNGESYRLVATNESGTVSAQAAKLTVEAKKATPPAADSDEDGANPVVGDETTRGQAKTETSEQETSEQQLARTGQGIAGGAIGLALLAGGLLLTRARRRRDDQASQH